MKGGAGCLLVTRFLTPATVNCACSRVWRMPSVCSLVASSAFCPSMVASFAANTFRLEGAVSFASMDQYSWVLNARISFSRSTTSRTATDCTRPADSPRFTFFHRKGLS